MTEESKKERKKKEERTQKEQDFMDSVHFWRAHPYREAWVEVCKKAQAFKREKTSDDAAEL